MGSTRERIREVLKGGSNLKFRISTKSLDKSEFKKKAFITMITRMREIEDRKDNRIKMQGTQESQLIQQRQNNALPTDFESAGFDSLGGFGLEQFEPR